MIPALIVPVLNRRDLLERMLASIDIDVRHIIIVDNGEVVGFDRTLLPESEDRSYRVIDLGHNIGVSAAWNLGMKVTPGAPWWVFANSDIEFGAGDLAHLESVINPDEAGLYYMLGMAAFAITAQALEAVGYFDENFHPAYDEDLDWSRRATLAGVPMHQAGFTGTHVGSATIRADPQLWVRNGHTHPANDVYYARKWGGRKQGGEQYVLPFDRGIHVGEWRLEPERLREQAWPRPARRE